MTPTIPDQAARWQVARWMSTKVQTLEPDDKLVDAFELMRLHRIRHVPVLENERLVGIVSDRDVRHALPLRDLESDKVYGRELLTTTIGRVMTRNPITTEPDAPIREAAMIIGREKIGALPVVQGDRLVGIVSAEDLLWAFVENTSDTPEA